jgi:hypothetical protein
MHRTKHFEPLLNNNGRALASYRGVINKKELPKATTKSAILF